MTGGPRTAGAFPDLSLPGLDGPPSPISEAWRSGRALVLLGHRTCKTTRQTLPYVDRIHRRCAAPHRVLAVLQDEAEEARELRRSLGLELEIRLEPDPYPLAAALGLTTVPTLFLVEAGRIEGVSEGFHRGELEGFAASLGVVGPLFDADDKAPALRPG